MGYGPRFHELSLNSLNRRRQLAPTYRRNPSHERVHHHPHVSAPAFAWVVARCKGRSIATQTPTSRRTLPEQPPSTSPTASPAHDDSRHDIPLQWWRHNMGTQSETTKSVRWAPAPAPAMEPATAPATEPVMEPPNQTTQNPPHNIPNRRLFQHDMTTTTLRHTPPCDAGGVEEGWMLVLMRPIRTTWTRYLSGPLSPKGFFSFLQKPL